MEPNEPTEAMIEAARQAFGGALSIRINMRRKINEMSPQIVREALSEALLAAERQRIADLEKIDAAE